MVVVPVTSTPSGSRLSESAPATDQVRSTDDPREIKPSDDEKLAISGAAPARILIVETLAASPLTARTV